MSGRVFKMTNAQAGKMIEGILLANGFADRMKELLDYNPTTGEFRWKVSRGGTAKAGSIAGSFRKDGYCAIKIDGRDFKAHRLAWLYMKGEWPMAEIDHIEQVAGQHFDNRFENLREASASENSRNQRMQANNSSGYHGVSWHKANSKWVAQIWHHGKRKYLGYFDTAEEAALAYDQTARELHGPFAKQNFPDLAA